MIKNVIFLVLSLLSMFAASAMFVIGNTNRALTELREVWFIPIPLALVFLVLAIVGFVKKLQKTN